MPKNYPPNVVVSSTAPPRAASVFLAIAASWHGRCGAGSAARPVFSCQSLSRLFWDSFFAALAPAPTDFVLFVVHELRQRRDDAPFFSVPFSLRRGALGFLTREPEMRCIWGHGDKYEWIAPRVMASESQPDGSVVLKKSRAFGPVYCSAQICLGRRCRSFIINAKWLLADESMTPPPAVSEGGSNLLIKSIDSWVSSKLPQQGATTMDAGVSSDAVRVAMPGCGEGSYCRMAFNKMVPDEALLISLKSSPEIKLTLIDVGITHKSKGIAEVASVTVSLHASFSSGGALVTRRKSGLVVFILHKTSPYIQYTDLVAVESTTGEVTHLTGECKELTQVSTSLFCVFSKRSYQLWDCNNLTQPLRGIHRDDGFGQVVGGRGFLFAITPGKILVIEALSGVVVFTLEVPTAQCMNIASCCSFLA